MTLLALMAAWGSTASARIEVNPSVQDVGSGEVCRFKVKGEDGRPAKGRWSFVTKASEGGWTEGSDAGLREIPLLKVFHLMVSSDKASDQPKKDYTRQFLEALGCTVLEMATGKRPWHERTFPSIYSAAYPISLSQDGPAIAPELSAPLRAFLGRCFTRDPAERPSASGLLKDPFMAESPVAPGGASSSSSK